MEHFLRECRCARVVAKSCCRCCCFRSRSRRCNRWWRLRASSLLVTAPRVSGSYCFSPTMWCLLLLVWLCSKPSCRKNETGLPHTRGSDGAAADLLYLSGAGGCSHRADDGGRSAYFLLSRALGLDGFLLIFREPDRVTHFSGAKKFEGRCSGRSRCGRGGRLLHNCADYGTDLGAAGVGHLVDLGFAPHADSSSVADLCQLSRSATLLRQLPDSKTRGSVGGFRSAGCAAGLLFYLVFSHPASPAGDWWRRLAGPAHVARIPHQPIRLLVLRGDGVLVALPAGAVASRGGE